jgi:putative hemolysin
MENNITAEILIIILLLLINGMFAMAEIAMVSARKVRLQQSAEDGNAAAKTALELAESPNRLLSTVQIGITLIGIFSGALGGAALAKNLEPVLAKLPWLAPYSSGLSLAIVILLITYFSLLIGELIPKRLALSNPERFAMALARPMKALAWFTSPVVHFLSISMDFGLHLLGVEASNEPEVTEEEIKVLMQQATDSGVFEEAEQSIMQSVFRLGDRRVDAIMTPHTEITWLNLDDPLEETLQNVLESHFNRFPVAQGSLDNVQGVLFSKDLLAALVNHQDIDLKTILKPALFLPESMPALKALEEFKRSGISVGLVIDEYGGLLGMVTPLNILESIVGDIRAPGQSSEPDFVQREDGSWLVDGLMQVDELKDMLDIDVLPEEDRVGYQTLGGFVMSRLGTIPTAGQHFEFKDLRFEVMDMDGRRVDKVLVSRLPQAYHPPAPPEQRL